MKKFYEIFLYVVASYQIPEGKTKGLESHIANKSVEKEQKKK